MLKTTWVLSVCDRLDCYIPISPLELDSVRLGVPSVQVGVEPSTDAGGVQVRTPRELY